MDNIETGVTLAIDITPLKEKIVQLVSEVESAFPEGLPDDIRSRLCSLSDNIVFGELSSTISANGTLEIVQRIHFGGCVDDLTAALRADNRNL
ncbi:hypothetical protein A6J71_10445 [Enterobacter cancerogenus]|uniref:hypothetical protein n=1 Tax=Enterobacter cancerogenus TaxID=69218 RepID=UPI000C9D1BEC|nr:hypothetical protein [Enterobacter cancerogenus]PNF10545.1 hypothetical protein A6J71_10445 [Enterobacter cancerogenus]